MSTKNTDSNLKEENSQTQDESNQQPQYHPVKVLLQAVAMAQQRGAYSMGEIGIISRAHQFLAMQFEEEDTENKENDESQQDDNLQQNALQEVDDK